MARILVNDVAQGGEKTARTWGELLQLLDRDLGEQGHLVTAARFDGVDEPSFRDAACADREIAGCQTIEIDASTPVALLVRCLADAAVGIERLCDGAITLADQFRGHDVAGANAGLADLGENIRALVQLVEALRLPLGIDVERLQWDGRPVPSHLEELGELVQSIIDAQEGHDWLTVADIIEYDLEPALRRWHAILLALHSAATRPKAA